MQKVFFFDIDETLLPLGEQGISDKNKYAIKQLQIQGYDVYIATGKSINMANCVLKELNVDKSITSNGNVIKEGDEIVFSYHLTKEDIVDIQNKVNATAGVILGGQGNYNTFLLTENEQVYQNHVKPIFDELGVMDLKQVKSIEENLYQMWILGDVDKLEIDKNKYDTFRWNEYGLDIIYKGTSKARAINFLLETKYKEKVETYAFGDSLNDVAMFELVDYAVAVSNAKEELKKVADYICDNSKNEGIYNFLVEKGLIKKI